MKKILSSLVLVVLATAGCTTTSTPAKETLRVMVYESFEMDPQLIVSFEQQYGVTVEILKSGDAGVMTNTAIINRNNPLADVMYGVDNVLLGRALASDIFEPVELDWAAIPFSDELNFTEQDVVAPVDYGFVCLNYDAAWFDSHQLPLPSILSDLTKPEYRSLLTVQNPASSSPGFLFLLNTIGWFGEEREKQVIEPDCPICLGGGQVKTSETGYEKFWRELKANQVAVQDSWSGAYYGEYSGSNQGGDRPLVVSYSTSPAAEVYYGDGTPTNSKVLQIPSGCVRQTEYAGILKGTEMSELANKWIAFMLSYEFQSQLPTAIWMYPARSDIELPEVFTQYAPIPAISGLGGHIAPEEVDAKWDTYLNAWEQAMAD